MAPKLSHNLIKLKWDIAEERKTNRCFALHEQMRIYSLLGIFSDFNIIDNSEIGIKWSNILQNFLAKFSPFLDFFQEDRITVWRDLAQLIHLFQQNSYA